MKEFNFALIFDFHNPQIDPDICSDALYEAGCNDGLFAVEKKSSIAIDFIRESESAYEAVFSLIMTPSLLEEFLIVLERKKVNPLSILIEVKDCNLIFSDKINF